MNSKNLAIFLSVVGAVLVVLLLVQHNDAVKEKASDVKTILTFSNDLSQTTAVLSEQRIVNATLTTNLAEKKVEIATLTTNLAARTEEAAGLSNKLTSTLTDLQNTRSDLAKTQADAKAAADAAEKKLNEEVSKRDQQIATLNANQEDLEKQIAGLKDSITEKNKLIVKTQKELDSTRGDKEFLLKELKRLQIEKADMEKQMNNLAFLHEQMKELKAEIATARRLDWIRRGVYDQDKKKGGQILAEGFKLNARTNAVPKLSVELSSDGTVTITPPSTNSPAASPAPKK